MSEVFEFFPAFRNFNLFLIEDLAWQVVNGDIFSIDNMSDEELRQSIVEDVTSVTMWEKQAKQEAVFTVDTLCRFLTPEQRQRVEEAMKHETIASFFDFSKGIRIHDNKETLQAAMDYCLVWFHGYDRPKGTISIDRNALGDAFDDAGGMENYATMLSMEINATHHGNNTVN